MGFFDIGRNLQLFKITEKYPGLESTGTFFVAHFFKKSIFFKKHNFSIVVVYSSKKWPFFSNHSFFLSKKLVFFVK